MDPATYAAILSAVRSYSSGSGIVAVVPEEQEPLSPTAQLFGAGQASPAAVARSSGGSPSTAQVITAVVYLRISAATSLTESLLLMLALRRSARRTTRPRPSATRTSTGCTARQSR